MKEVGALKMKLFFVFLLLMIMASHALAAGKVPENGKKLGTILNNDVNNILYSSSGSGTTVEEYKRGVLALLDGKLDVLAQDVGLPDPVIFRSKVATTWDRYIGGAEGEAMRKLLELGADPLTITIQACRERNVLILASFRMNSGDYEPNQQQIYDFGRRAPKEWLIPGTNVLDPAVPEVYAHRMAIFKEIIDNYDIDGIELNFMRGLPIYQVSNPAKNHVVLTRMVADVRKLLDDAARKKGLNRLLLGVRVPPTLDDPRDIRTFLPGAPVSSSREGDASCKASGLDVRTWIRKGLVDYVCPSQYWGRLPGGTPRTSDFVQLAKNTRCGIYPTVFAYARWQETGPLKGPINETDTCRMQRFKENLCMAALNCYAQGADGISAFNWFYHHRPDVFPGPWPEDYGMGAMKLSMYILSKMNSPSKLIEYLNDDSALLPVENAEVRNYLSGCEKTAAPPVIDGHLDEACWAKADRMTDFVTFQEYKRADGSVDRAPKQTEIRACYDNKYLYLGATLMEPNMDKLTARFDKRDQTVFGDDSLEIFFDIDHNHADYYQFAVNSIGTVYDAKAGQPAASFNPDLRVGTFKQQDRWSVEMAIPLREIGLKPSEGKVIGVNFCRDDFVGTVTNISVPGEHGLSSWVPTSEKFGRPELFGHIVFGTSARGLSPEVIKTYCGSE